ncbi:hypothetical protein OG264_01410 [Streptomyces xanthophaeus]|uniref:hypothetical protein n=1 Tax=Streptomyces xanthophaeus TaxID=67385 RepID=UPI0038659E3D|nr:hypothetical protein OG264_01410 [Streptomyces xanthophaeus]WST64750.1 hypothetical protein OG605_36950 [Streptomyces xanthophaeus]
MSAVDAVLKELGSAHEGTIGVLLADGSEPGPVHFDVGSGPDTPSSTAWHAYDGRRGRPRAAALRGACSCGWRGMATYTLDWTRLKDRPLWEAGIDLCGPLADVGAHLSVVRDKAVPLPAPLTAVLTDLAAQLSQAAVQSPLVALKALADLRHVIAGVGQDAARAVAFGQLSWEEVAAALGTTEKAARQYVTSYLRS